MRIVTDQQFFDARTRDDTVETPSRPGTYDHYPHRIAFRQALSDLDRLPQAAKAAERLSMASSLIEATAYALAQDLPSHEVTRLFLIAAEVDREIERLSKVMMS